jgi:hypothetical protein
MPNVNVIKEMKMEKKMSFRLEDYPNYNELLDLAVEALKRSNMYLEQGHPEDLVVSLTPTLEAVALGFGAGIRWAREHGTV